jgi:RimJ/RimL family protein N-acetyltransferase
MEIESLVLRRPVDFDADEILDLAIDPEVMRWNPLRAVVDLESARTWCRESADWAVGDHATWIAIDGSSGLVVATCAIFDISLGQGTAGIGYRVAEAARRQGVARSCVDVVTKWAYEEYDLTRVQLAHSVENLASCNVAVSAGYEPEGTLRSSYVDIMGVRHDEHIHGRLRTDATSTAPIPVRLDP